MPTGFSYGPDVSFQSEQSALDRRRKLAEALQAQSMQPIQSARPDAPISWTQGLAQMLNTYAGKKKMNEVERQQKDLSQQQEQRRSADMALLAERLRGTAAQPAGLTEDASGNVTQRDAIPAQTPVQSIGQAIPMMGPGMQPIALNAMMGAQQRQDQQEFQRQQAEDARQGRLAQFQLSSEEKEAAQRRQQEFLAQQDRLRAQDRSALVQMQLDANKAGNKPPPGYRPTKEGNLEAIPGGPADVKAQGAFNQDTAALNGANSAMDRLAVAANETLNHPGLKGITGLRGAIPNIPGSAAADAQAKLNTLKSQVAFGVLQEMRNNSKTGGALGNVSDAEGRRLEANLAALENAQSYEQMQDSLRKIMDYAEGAKGRLREAFNLKHGEKQPQYAGPERRAPAQLPQGVKVIRVQ